MSAYGYQTQNTTVTVTAGETVTQDFALATAPMGTVVGSVSDGSGHDWPLYSKLTVDGAAPDGFSDPSTGEFSLSLPVGTYSVTVDSEYPGYVPETREITVTEGQSTQDFVLEVDSTTCTAPGYTFNTTGTVTEDFNDGALPAGWTIDDNLGNGQVWTLRRPGQPRQPHRWRRGRSRSRTPTSTAAGIAGHLARQPGDGHVRDDRPGGRLQAGLQPAR